LAIEIWCVFRVRLCVADTDLFFSNAVEDMRDGNVFDKPQIVFSKKTDKTFLAPKFVEKIIPEDVR
jgi:hypothetical protein